MAHEFRTNPHQTLPNPAVNPHTSTTLPQLINCPFFYPTVFLTIATASMSNQDRQDTPSLGQVLLEAVQTSVQQHLAIGGSRAEVREQAKELNSLGLTIRADFEALITSPGYTCRFRLPLDKHTRVCVLLSDPTSARGASDHNLFQWARANFELREHGRVLYRNPKKGYTLYRRVRWASEVFDIITRAHLKALHTSRDKT